MEEALAGKILTKIGVAILAIALADLFFLNYWILKNGRVDKTSETVGKIRNVITASSSASATPAVLASASPAASSSPNVTVETKTVVEKQTQIIVQNAQKEIFVPMGSGSTNSNTFADLGGAEVTIDTSKYGAIDSIVFEASLWVEGGNGQVVARLRNITDNNPYVESQISNNGGTGAIKTSGNIPFPSGQKTYRVQAKTDITNYAAHVENARIKITLK